MLQNIRDNIGIEVFCHLKTKKFLSLVSSYFNFGSAKLK